MATENSRTLYVTTTREIRFHSALGGTKQATHNLRWEVGVWLRGGRFNHRAMGTPRKGAGAYRQKISFQPTLAQVPAQHLHDAAVRAQEALRLGDCRSNLSRAVLIADQFI